MKDNEEKQEVEKNITNECELNCNCNKTSYDDTSILYTEDLLWHNEQGFL